MTASQNTTEQGHAPTKAYSIDEEFYNFDSLHDALDHLDAIDGLQPGMVVHEGDVVRRRASHYAPGIDWIIDQITDAAYNEGGEFAEDFPDVEKTRWGELEKLIADWMDANVPVNFFTITNSRPITVTDEMIAEFRAIAKATGSQP